MHIPSTKDRRRWYLVEQDRSVASVQLMMTSSKGDVAFPFAERCILFLLKTDVEMREKGSEVPSIIFVVSSYDHMFPMSDNNNGLPPLPPPPPLPPGRANGGRRAGAGNCSREEQLHFLGIMERIPPIGPCGRLL